MELAGYFFAILMGVSLGIIGGGGAILTVPILIYFFSFEAVTAATGSLFVVGSTALAGAIVSIYKKNVDFKTGFIFAIPSFLGVFLIRKFLLPKLPETILSTSAVTLTKSSLILVAFAILMLFSAKAMIQKNAQLTSTDPALDAAKAWEKILTKGFFVGCVTGLVGAGGGFLIVPALNLFFKLPMQRAIGTSLVIISANSLFGFIMSDNAALAWPKLFAIGFLGVVGLLLGQRFTVRVSEGNLKKIFGYFILSIGVILLTDQFL